MTKLLKIKQKKEAKWTEWRKKYELTAKTRRVRTYVTNTKTNIRMMPTASASVAPTNYHPQNAGERKSVHRVK